MFPTTFRTNTTGATPVPHVDPAIPNDRTFSSERNITAAVGGSANRLLTRSEAASYLGVRPHTLSTWACNKRYHLPYVKVGRNVRYRQQDLDAFIQCNTHGIDAVTGGANV